MRTTAIGLGTGLALVLATFLDRAKAAVKAGATKDTLVAAIKTDDLWTFNPNAWTGARPDGLYAEAGGK